MTDKQSIKTSKFLSLVLRHEPERVGLALDSAGWIGVTDLLAAVNGHGVSLTLDQLKHIVATSEPISNSSVTNLTNYLPMQ